MKKEYTCIPGPEPQDKERSNKDEEESSQAQFDGYLFVCLFLSFIFCLYLFMFVFQPQFSAFICLLFCLSVPFFGELRVDCGINNILEEQEEETGFDGN